MNDEDRQRALASIGCDFVNRADCRRAPEGRNKSHRSEDASHDRSRAALGAAVSAARQVAEAVARLQRVGAVAAQLSSVGTRAGRKRNELWLSL